MCEGGADALVNTLNGRQFDCNHEVCPPGSFCRHALGGAGVVIARCCSNGMNDISISLRINNILIILVVHVETQVQVKQPM